MDSFLSYKFFKFFLSTVNMFISIFMIQILHNITNSWIFSDIGRNYLLGSRKKIVKFLMRTFTCRSTFLNGAHVKKIWFSRIILISLRWVKCLGVGMKPNLVLNEDEKKVQQYNIINCNSYSEVCNRAV